MSHAVKMDDDAALNLFLRVSVMQTTYSSANLLLYVMACWCVRNGTMVVDIGGGEIARLAGFSTNTGTKAATHLRTRNFITASRSSVPNGNLLLDISPLLSGTENAAETPVAAMDRDRALELIMWADERRTKHNTVNLLLYTLVMMCVKQGTMSIKVSGRELGAMAGLTRSPVVRATDRMRNLNLVDTTRVARGVNLVYHIRPQPRRDT